MKRCTWCGIMRWEKTFYRCANTPTGLDHWCIPCRTKKNLACKKKYITQFRLKQKKWRVNRKLQVFAAYGNKCSCCGETKKAFLTIDHIFNDGIGDYRGLYDRLIKLGFPKDRYRLLCFNCNCGRRVNGGVCPHKTRRELWKSLAG
jgi:hypothetical protein